MTFHMPAESVPLRRRSRFFDWRFLVSLTALILVCLLVWASIRNYDIREVEAAQKDALIAQAGKQAEQIADLQHEVAQMQDRLDAARAQARQDRREAHRERARLIRQQATMIRLLKRSGVVPRRYTPARTSRPAPRVSSSGTASGTSRRATSAPRSTARPKTRGTSRPTAGKSGKTPKGKAKGLRK